MKFKFYDIISHLIPGFIIYVAYLSIKDLAFDKDYIVPATAISFLIGYFVNTISSWIEGFFFFTWRGKPSNKLLDGKGIWKVKFYDHQRAKDSLLNDIDKSSASNDELFQYAMRYATPEINSRVQDFNTNYAFSRVILTTILIIGGAFIYENPKDINVYFCFIPLVLIAWIRCKQRAYYFGREVLNTYLKSKDS